VALFKELRTQNLIYTLESTFAGIDSGKNKGECLSIAMLQKMGEDLCRTLLIH